MSSPLITSAANPRVKWIAGLRKRRRRDAEGVTVVEGYAEVSLAVAAGVQPSLLVYCPDLVSDPDAERAVAAWRARLDRNVEVQPMGRAAFAKACYRESPDGWLAVVPTPGRALAEVELSSSPLLLVAESVEKPGNLGAMLRTAEAVGVDAVIAASPVADWGNPNLVRSSKGTVFAVPVAAAPAPEVADWLADRGIAVVVASPDGEAAYTDADLSSGTAVVVGAEHSGVSEVWVGARRVRLPMAGTVNSLNVSATAAVLLYEALRQRPR